MGLDIVFLVKTLALFVYLNESAVLVHVFVSIRWGCCHKKHKKNKKEDSTKDMQTLVVPEILTIYQKTQ